MSTTLRRYLSLHSAMIAALPVVIIAFLVWLFLVPQLRTHSGVQQAGMARAIAGQISAHLSGGERQLNALANLVEMNETYSAAQLTSLLDAECGNGEFFETIYIVEEKNELIASIGLALHRRSKRDELLGIDLSGRSFLNRTRRAGKLLWSETFLSTVSSRLAVALTVPRSGRIIVGEITLAKLSEYISHLPVEADLHTIVLDRQGRIVADSQQLRWGQQLNLATLPASPPEGNAGFSSSNFELDGKSFMGSVLDVPQLGWKVLVAQPMQSAFSSLRTVYLMIAVGLGIALILAFAAAWQQAGRLSGFFQFYTRQAKSLAQGSYEPQPPPSRITEFMHLGESLHQTSRIIVQREKALVESETYMRITLDSIGDAVIATDANGGITQMNPAAEKLTGWSSLEAVGRPLTEVFRIVNARTRRPAFNPVEKILLTGETIGLANHTMLIARDGHEYQIADSGAPIRHTDGHTVGVVLVFRDVTESYAQEQKLRENEKQLKEITANVPGVVYRWKSTREHVYTTTYVSRKAFELFGLDADPQTFFAAFCERIPNDEKNGYLASIREAVDRVSPWRYEGRFIKPGGEVIWFSGNAIPYKEDDAILFYGVLLDTTWRRKLEESLRITQFSFDKAAIGIYRVGSDARILDVNDQAARSLGYSKQELCTKSIYDIDPGINSENWVVVWQQLLEQGVDVLERIHRRKDGSEFPVEIYANLLEYDGQYFSIAFVQDITERKEAMETLRHLRNYLSNIINSMPSTIVGVDTDGRVTQWNRTAEQTTGVVAPAARGERLSKLLPWMASEMEKITQSIQTHQVIQEQKRPRTKNEGICYEDVTIFPLITNGSEGAVVRIDDVTEKVRLEEMMVQSEKMLSVGGLAAGMAHEINNPLAGMMQTAEVLANRLGVRNLHMLPNRKAAEAAGTTMEAIQRFMEARGVPRMLAAISESGRRVAAIVDNMLSFSRKSDATASSHAVDQLIEKALALAATDYDLKKNYDFKLIEIRKEYADILPSVPCEGAKIQQVLLNILRNGAQAMQGAGMKNPTLTLRTSYERDSGMVCIEIEDNGPGMDEATRKRVFEPFFTTKPVGVGTGLGMSVSYFIITENHGGELRVDSAPGLGARFTIKLPLADKDRRL